ncbi:MAG: transglycosylase domain-containing protein, partial [Bacteroidetes bacterium]|nr:transglycosylase domain-containing protein [Bacteroidota bacterium]
MAENGSNKSIKTFWMLYFGSVAFVLLLFIIISIGGFGFMPSFEELENPKSSLASEIYSADQVQIGKYYIENRTNANYNELSPNLIHALIATEDSRFENHSGIDFRSVFRVLFKNILGGNRSSGGGSTISQQLAKNLFPREENPSIFKMVIIKLKEWVTAIKLERNYTKEEIIAMYLNTVDFGSQSFGIKSAAKTYFNKTPDKLNIEESALLIGLLQAPSKFSPKSHKDRAMKRREVVLFQMKKYNYLT